MGGGGDQREAFERIKDLPNQAASATGAEDW
jgi:hypothetical protein